TENWRRHLFCAVNGVLPRGTSQAKHGVETQQHFPSTIIAISTALVFSFYQLIYAHSRWLLLDIPVTLFTTLSYLFLIKSGWGCKRKETILAGVLAACAMLTKAQAVVYFVIPALYVVVRIANGEWRIRLLNLAISLIVCLLLFSLWALPNLTHMYEYVKAGATIRLNHPDDLRSITTWTFYLKLIINNITTLWGFLLWIPACFIFLRKHKKHTLFIISVVIGYYLWFSLISNKDLRFIYPIFPMFAYIGAYGWARILIYLHDKRKAVWMGVAIATLLVFLVFQITMYTVLSFGWPFPKNITSYVLVPGIDDITVLNTASDYPVKAYGADKWPVQELAQDLKDYFADKPFTYVFLVPNFEYFNNNTITLELTRIRAQNVVLMGGINKQSFENPRELDDFVKQYAHFIYVEGEFGPYFQWDRAFYAQVQQYVADIYSLGRSKTHKSYQLPNGQIVHWFIIDP
ncbi:MAG TPA: phospholipid carrier-dependent glycosyltransferase, partial [Candidatus Woesebacteria bacterium]|nr:phospholipid carrier-dependent glycosyltransferase [Candidatus Woesebacteria bacterium]